MSEIKVWKAHCSFKGLMETEGMEKDRIQRVIENSIKYELDLFKEIKEIKVTLELI